METKAGEQIADSLEWKQFTTRMDGPQKQPSVSGKSLPDSGHYLVSVTVLYPQLRVREGKVWWWGCECNMGKHGRRCNLGRSG